MSEHDGQRHELGGFVAGVAEHEALIARATGIDAHGDIGRLRLDHIDDGAGFRIEAEGSVVVADVINHAPDQAGHVDIRLGGDFARDDAEARGHQRFAGDTPGGIVGQHGIQNSIGDLVRNFVGMTFCHRFRREDKFHRKPFLLLGNMPAWTLWGRVKADSTQYALLRGKTGF